jgi:hypothetical protein
VQLVALPTDFVTLRVLLGAYGASRVEIKEHLLQRLTALALQGTGLRGVLRLWMVDRVCFLA